MVWYYDAIYLLADILSQHPAASGERLSQLIRASDYTGLQGTYAFDEQGEGLHSVTLVQMQNGIPRKAGEYSAATGFVPLEAGRASP